MSLLIESNHAARELLVVIVAVAAVAEVAATHLGQARDGRRRIARVSPRRCSWYARSDGASRG